VYSIILLAREGEIGCYHPVSFHGVVNGSARFFSDVYVSEEEYCENKRYIIG